MAGVEARDIVAGGRLVLVTLVALILIAIPSASVAAEDSNFSLSLQIDEPTIEDWYIAGDALTINLAIINLGNADSLISNPTCPVALLAHDALGNLLYDSLQDSTCRQQSRGTDFAAGEQIEWANIEWDFKDNSNEWINSGDITITVSVPETGLSSSFDIQWQSPLFLGDGIEIQLTPAQTQSGTYDSANPLFVSIQLVNLGEETIADKDCRIQIKAKQNESIIHNKLTNLRCANNQEVISQFEIINLGWLEWNFEGAESGNILIEIGFAGQQLFSNFSLDYSDLGSPLYPQLLGNNSPLVTELFLSHPTGPNGIVITGTGDSLGFSSTYTNTHVEDLFFSFQNTCRMEIFVLNQRGNIVYDSRDNRECRALNVDHILEENEMLTFTHADWGMTDRQGCNILTGDYLVVVESDELRVHASALFHHVDDGSGQICNAEEGDTPINISTEVQESNNGYSVGVSLLSEVDGIGLYFNGPCKVIVSLSSIDGEQHFGEYFELCGADQSQLQYVISSENLFEIGQINISMTEGENTVLEPGEYEITLTLNSWPYAEEKIIVDWNNNSIEEDDFQTSSDDIGSEGIPSNSQIVSGSWSYITTESGGCWILNTNSQQLLLTDTSALSNWQPEPHLSGTYGVLSNANVWSECSTWENSISVITIYDETKPPVENNQEIDNNAEVSDAPSVIEEYAPVAISAITSVSVLSLLLVTIVSNEAWRIPASQFGLTIIGLIGRTHETTDGRYQRGRLMGYLTANPGCHFRALMGALSMSNGQITHHLKVLEEEDNLWRRKDGRLVRYYPATISFNTPEDELPIPALTPDPNSLQGKILRLLDHDGEMGTYPTQSDLADRLEKSQQLISHHLRTLQKYGLVEKTRGGLKHRYHLTKEAVFLLNNVRP
ncbi:MAG: ArsR family transcriptional regulator [Euryarchaeota archaeon]|nr:ArsR family transcriptional regulator [Euryarchaeota archaeon]